MAVRCAERLFNSFGRSSSSCYADSEDWAAYGWCSAATELDGKHLLFSLDGRAEANES